jgi:hypothetical protein
MYTLVQTAKLNNVDPQAWLVDVLARIANHQVNRGEAREETNPPSTASTI